jgi:hypothetical protein
MTAAFSVFDTLIQNGNDIINGSAVDNNQILDKKTVGRIPSAMQHSTGWIEKVSDLFIVNLCERRLNRKLLVFLLRVFPSLLKNVP